jgi:hypothetical protein
VPLHVSAHYTLSTTEAPNGAVFYAQRPVVGERGTLSHRSAAKVVRVVHGNRAPAVAEHAPAPVLALAANRTSLYVVTTQQVVKYSRSTGAKLRTWALPAKSTYAGAVLTTGWLYVDSAFECDFCGYEPSTLVAINMRTHATHTVSTNVARGSVTARGRHVYYGNLSVGHLFKTTATAPRNHHTARSPTVGLFDLGFFGNRILTWGIDKDGVHASLWLIDPRTMKVVFTRRIKSPQAFDIVETAHGPVMSNSTCPPELPADACTSPNAGELGDVVSDTSLRSGAQTNPLVVPGVYFLIGPRPAAITVGVGGYQLVRIS